MKSIRQEQKTGSIPEPVSKAWARGFEPPTFWSVARRSIQLSYAHIAAYLSQQKLLYYTLAGLSRKK